MKFNQDCVNETSIHHFVRPSSFALEALFWMESFGRFDVKSDYKVSRLHYNSYLMIVILSGSIGGHCGDLYATASRGEVLLLDCHRPHTYYATQPSQFYFVHFGGAMSDALFQIITSECGLVVDTSHFDLFVQIFEFFIQNQTSNKPIHEAKISADIYRMLMFLVADAHTDQSSTEDKQTVNSAIDYILGHVGERLNVDTLASKYGYSPSYFSRIFKRRTGYAPYQFILNARIERSIHLLSNTNMTIQEIANSTGFSTLTNFSYAFRKTVGTTPSAYRKKPI